MWTFTEFQMNLRLMFLARNRGKNVNFIRSNHKKDENKQFALSFVLKGFAKWSPVTGNSHDTHSEIKLPQGPWKTKQEYLTLCSYFPLSVPKWQLLLLCFLSFFYQVFTSKTQIYLKHLPFCWGIMLKEHSFGFVYFCLCILLMWNRNPHKCLFCNWLFVFGKYKFKTENRNLTNQSYPNWYFWS